MTKRKFFGTDGVRGPYGGPLINENFAERLGVAAGRFASRHHKPDTQCPLLVVLGRDTRGSGESLLRAVAAGLSSVGATCLYAGIVPTPAVACAIPRERAALGVVITASHNPAEDNGIKFFGADGTKLSDEQEIEIENLLPEDRPTLTTLNTMRPVEALAPYLQVCGALLAPDSLRGWKIVVDTANGATCETTPATLKALGAEVVQIGASPNGANINDNVGSEHTAHLAARVRESGARIGIAHDGDGDRCVLSDENGDVLDGDEVLTLLAIDALARGQLANNLLVVTIQSNLGVDTAITRAGGRVLRANVGDRYVVEQMRKEGARLGGESSGHFVCADVFFTGDGLVSALRVIEVMARTGRPLSELKKNLVKFPQLTRNLTVREKRPLETLPHLPMAIERLERELGASGRVLVRFSGTEPKLRLLVEAPTAEIAQTALSQLEKVARADLEVL